MKGKARESMPLRILFLFPPPHFFFFLEIVIQQKERAVFIQCNPFTVMTSEKSTAAKLFRAEMLQSEKKWEQGADNQSDE